MSRMNFMARNGGSTVFAGIRHGRTTSQPGFSLIELMIAMTLGLLILLAVSSIFVGSRQTFRMQEENARLQETGRYALEVMGRSIRQAGFWNLPINPVATATAFVGTPITGVDGGAASDTVTVQYDGLTGDRDCLGAVLAADAVITDVYSLDAANSELECNGQALVGDIEDVQILYGLTNQTNDPLPDNPLQSAVQYIAAPSAVDWPRVVSARVCVQARSANHVNTAPQRFLNCGGALGTATGAAAFTTAGAGDRQLRRTFVATYNLRNRVNLVP